MQKRRSKHRINLVSKENSSSFWCNTEHRLHLNTTQSRQPTWLKGAKIPISYHSSLLRFFGGLFLAKPHNATGILFFEGSFSYDFWLGTPPVEKALGDFANILNFFFPKMNLVFVSMGGQGKVLFGDSLVYSKGHILGCPKLGDPKAPFHPPATMELNWEEKNKNLTGSPPLCYRVLSVKF